MAPRPQFSLRTLMIVMALVCLAAATAYQPHEERHVTIECQTMLRCTLLVAFPTICLIGAIQARTHAQAFYIGTMLPMIFPGMIAWHGATLLSNDAESLGDVADALQAVSEFVPRRTATFWALAPLVGVVCVVADWFLKPGSDWRAMPLVQMAIRLVVAACLMVVLMAGTIVLPAAGGPVEDAAIQPLLVSSCVPAAVLLVSAVRCRGYARSFFAGSALPTIFILPALSQEVVFDLEPPHQWLFYIRYFIIAAWMLAPCVGLAAVGFHWLFRLSEAR